jgi:hypothetical protein
MHLCTENIRSRIRSPRSLPSKNHAATPPQNFAAVESLLRAKRAARSSFSWPHALLSERNRQDQHAVYLAAAFPIGLGTKWLGESELCLLMCATLSGRATLTGDMVGRGPYGLEIMALLRPRSSLPTVRFIERGKRVNIFLHSCPEISTQYRTHANKPRNVGSRIIAPYNCTGLRHRRAFGRCESGHRTTS